MLKKKLAVLLCLAFNQALFGHFENDNDKAINSHPKSYKPIIAHTATGIIANYAFLKTAIWGALAGAYACDNQIPTWIGRKLGVTPEGFLCEDRKIIGAVLFIPMLAGLIAGYYIFYKTPQWTDTYLLKINTLRTTKQNLISSACRLLPWPVGVWIGEYYVRKDAQKVAQSLDIQNTEQIPIEEEI